MQTMLLALVIVMTMQVHNAAARREKLAHTGHDEMVNDFSHSSSHGDHGALQPELVEQSQLQLAEAIHQNSSHKVSNCCFNGGSCKCQEATSDMLFDYCKALHSQQIVKEDLLESKAYCDYEGDVSPRMIACILNHDKCIRCTATQVKSMCGSSVAACPSVAMLLALLTALALVMGKDEP
jgi:hypothetical protein